MPYIFVRETVRCQAPALEVLGAIHEAMRSSDVFEGSIHAARFQLNYRGRPRLQSFVIGNGVAAASSCELTLRFYVSRDRAKLLMLIGLLLLAAASLRLWPWVAPIAACGAGLAVQASLEMRELLRFFQRLDFLSSRTSSGYIR